MTSPLRLLALLLALGLAAVPGAGSADPGSPEPSRDRPAASYRQVAPQTSDGLLGRIAPLRAPGRSSEPQTTVTARWKVAPGVRFHRFDRVDDRGRVRGHVLRVDLATPGVSIDYAGRSAVAAAAPLLDTLQRDRAVAGVNGDFFDITGTDAPLGVGKDRQRGFLHGPTSGWNNAFFIRRDGTPDIDVLTPAPEVKGRPDLVVSTVNSPSVRQGGIGLYTSKWGTLRGYAVTDGQRERVRFVHLRAGRVVANKSRLPASFPVVGKVLIGRDEARKPLRRLSRGTKVKVRNRVTPRVQMAITGNLFLIRDGLVVARDDREMHPRTAIGIDRDADRLILVVVDGRQDFSRGHTMVELATLMAELGADEALNLDGGGSSTMVTKRRGRPLTVANSPSDGSQRPVPNGLAVFHDD